MKGFSILPRHDVLLAMAVMVLVGVRVVGQTQGGDEPVFTPSGGSTSLLGPSPGAGGGVFSNLPGTGGLLGGRPGPTTPKGIPTSVTSPTTAMGPTALQAAITAPQPEPITPSTGELYGTLEIPAGTEDDGPENGLTLDAAIDITLERSLDLRSKYYEIPQSRADILQASLRANPVFYQDGQLLAYPGYHFSRAVPGGPSQYDTNITFLLDVMHKRQARTYVAQRARKFLRLSIKRRCGSGSTTSMTPTSSVPWRLGRRFDIRTPERQGTGEPRHHDRAALQGKERDSR